MKSPEPLPPLRGSAPASLVIVDADVPGDNRVQRSIDKAAGPSTIIDIRVADGSASPLRTLVDAALCLARGMSRPLARYRVLGGRLAGRVAVPLFSGLPACIRWTTRAARAAQAIRRALPVAPEARTVVHAHDLYCGLAAALAMAGRNVHLVYDAHELEIHRNRKTGWLRILIEHGLEQFVLDRAAEVRVVNHAIERLMREWYAMPSEVRVTYNDFYAVHPVAAPAAAEPPAIVYVGMGVNGRQLQLLDQPAHALPFEVHVYLLGAELPSHIEGSGWIHGPRDYRSHLLALASTRRCLMWCCLDNECLSYELATPNKFFQALALGMPIIASPGTYLADLVRAHGIGAVFDGDNLDEIAAAAAGTAYEGWAQRVTALRCALRNGSVVI